MAPIAEQEARENPNAVKPRPPPSSSTAAYIQLSDSDSSISDDEANFAINSGDTASAKRTRVSDGQIPLKRPKLEDDILPLGFLDPLPPEDPPEVVIAQPISVLPPTLPPARAMAMLRNCKQFWKAGDYDGQPIGSNTLPGKFYLFLSYCAFNYISLKDDAVRITLI